MENLNKQIKYFNNFDNEDGSYSKTSINWVSMIFIIGIIIINIFYVYNIYILPYNTLWKLGYNSIKAYPKYDNTYVIYENRALYLESNNTRYEAIKGNKGIKNAALFDLNDDGYDEICATVQDDLTKYHVEIYDPYDGQLYVIKDTAGNNGIELYKLKFNQLQVKEENKEENTYCINKLTINNGRLMKSNIDSGIIVKDT